MGQFPLRRALVSTPQPTNFKQTQNNPIRRWDKTHDADNAIENSLYLTTAAKLANRKPHSPSEGYYLNEALNAYTFITTSGLINSQSLLNDGLRPYNTSDPLSCKNNGLATWSYNQGAIIPGLAEMTWSTGDKKYTDLAISIATAAVTLLTDKKGILHDTVCEPGCVGDSGQFKGVLARGVQFLVQRAGMGADTKALLVGFLKRNADSIWNNARSSASLGPLWSGPYLDSSVQAQSSALDAIIGAACVS
jgi:predicted alpha-1,6-mannanase (GH76 family)